MSLGTSGSDREEFHPQKQSLLVGTNPEEASLIQFGWALNSPSICGSLWRDRISWSHRLLDPKRPSDRMGTNHYEH